MPRSRDPRTIARAERLIGYLSGAAAEAELIGDDRVSRALDRLADRMRVVVAELNRERAGTARGGSLLTVVPAVPRRAPRD